MSQIAGPLTIGAAALPSDLPMTTTCSAPVAASSACLGLAAHPLERVLLGRRALVDLDNGPSAGLRGLAGEPEQRRLAEVANSGKQDDAARRVTLVLEHGATLTP